MRTLVLLAAISLKLFSEQTTYVLSPVSGPNGATIYADDINNRGAIVGLLQTPNRGSYGFRRSASGNFELIVDPSIADGTSASGINNFGTVVGSSHFVTQGLHSTTGYIRFGGADGSFRTINVSDAVEPYTVVTGVNDFDDFVGYTRSDGSTQVGFVNVAGTNTFFWFPGPSGALSTSAQALSWDGTIVGCSAGLHTSVGFVRGPKGKLVGIQVSNAAQTCALGINNAAETIVGYYTDQTGKSRGFVYDYLADLGSLSAAPVNSTITIPIQTIEYPNARHTRVTGVNAQGTLVGWAELPGGRIVSFVGNRQR